ncbi:RagB/SusD family nutrient uptake outer membrane protein [Mucilaginibacter mali]|uniref:RagB/SusD family nutrient uptake outer membrane protein n=1 Tax=Mucilaginibacter mali TaxID=2740462 RepID=A0A7D4UCX6_9SPHI|nr:RagB/SusD family nutrient uptake outer membrane protein [Mucilaginibacter mali]QKJ29899.1 RagB/SusD family nutrient uptake outer membrane protein [Mucilaginibacter mali]
MKRNIIYLLLALAGLYTAGCKKDTFLQDGSIPPDGAITEAQEWANPDFARNYLNNVYASLQSRYNLDGDGSMLASGSDEAVNSNLNSSINIFNNGTWSPVRTIDDVYSNMYSGIRKANIFLAKAYGSAVIPAQELVTSNAADITYDAQIARLRGQAFYLRAFFEFELVKRYGSMVLVTRVLNSDENLDLPRNSFDDCVKQIVADCDSAADRLPDNAAAWATNNRGRATKIAAQALKARLLLYAASPQYNPSNDLTKWQTAATAAKVIIDGGKAGLYTSYPNIFLWNISGAPYNTEVIFATQTANDATVETNNAPISYNGANGRTDPTQNLVDAFEMKTTGRVITDPLSGYNANAPYTNRDPRLGFSVMLNGSTFQSKTVDIYAGGKDAIGVNVNATKTGYYMRKFLAEAAVWNTSSNTSVRKPWVLYRYAEVLLNYAEAINEAQGTAGMAEVLKSLNLIRARGGVAMPALQTTNAAGNGYVAPTQAELRKRIHLERQVELCFEEHRFYDVRRWKEAETTFSLPARGMNITQTSPGVFTYSPFTVENRVFTAKNYLFPIAQVELNKAPALKQNPGY